MSSMRAQAREGLRPSVAAAVATILALIATILIAPQAWAGPGSRISGFVWSDVNRDGTRTADESLKGGITVELLSGPTGPVVATTTTAANGTYSFSNVANGTNFHVRTVAPAGFRYPDVAAGQNDFRRAEVPAAGSPERGIAGPLTISGATLLTTIDAGLQPLATLQVDRLAMADACESYASTGAPPWDAASGPGMDTSSADCIVRVGDTVLQNYSASLTGLPSGATVPNVVMEFRINPVRNPNDPSDVADSRFQLAGPGTNGLPEGCLTAANGANPASSVTTNADGSLTVICNLGSMSSNVAAVQLAYRFADNTPIPGFAEVTARAYTGADDAGESNTVSGPIIEVTGTAEWEAKKSFQGGPSPQTRTINGVPTPGFFVQYWVDLDNLRGTGGSDLQWPITFTDRMTKFPNAIIVNCNPRRVDNAGLASDWVIGCPLNEPAGTDGWSITAARPASSPWEDTRILMGIFVPTEDAYRSIDPTWQRGDTPPTGTVSWQNNLEDTDGWHMVGGQPNNPPGGIGPGFEAGWDGTTATGDNVVPRQFNTSEPRWDLSKTSPLAPTFQERDTDNNPSTPAVPGFVIQYNFAVNESNGSILTTNLDNIAFKDVMTQYPDAILLSCAGAGGNWNTGTPTCETGVQPADGWDMSFTPNANGNNTKTNTWSATFFIPTPTIPDPCRANVNDTLTFRNEARQTDGWTADDWPMNNTGFEPGWDGTTATGNNVSTRTINVRSTVSDCGTLTGNKQYESLTGGLSNWNQFSPGDVINSHVWTTATNNRLSVTDPVLCDVFDVSVWRISGNPLAPNTGGDPNPHLQARTATMNAAFDLNNYVIEYAIGANAVDTQTGTGNGLNNTANVADVRQCRDDEGPWTTDPAATFGADWRDRVNMVRVRPINAGHVETGPFTLGLYVPLQARWEYNGGPNAGEDIPAGILMNNSGSWPERDNTTGQIVYRDVSRQLTSSLPITGAKAFTNAAGNAWADNTTVASGTQVQSWVEAAYDSPPNFNPGWPARGVQAPGAEDTRGFPVENPMVCDVFDVSTFRLNGAATSTSTGLANPGEWIIEYAIGSNAVDTQAGARTGGLFPVDRSSLVDDAEGCRDEDTRWETNPASFGADWADRVNMVRMRPVDPDHIEYADFRLWLRVPLVVRSFYNGGPNDGEAIETGVRLSNVGGWSTGQRGEGWTTMEKETRFQGMQLIVAKSATQATYLPGQDAVWNLSVGLNNARVGAVMEDLRLVDSIPVGMTYNATCTRSRLPAGVTVDYNPATREVTFFLGDITATAANYWVRTGASAIQVCATLDTIAQPGDTYVNTVQALSPSSENSPTAQASTRAAGSGQMGIFKDVDKPFVASGERYTWSIDWANTSSVIAFTAPDIIDVLPWNGDGQAGVGSQRNQFASSYEGLAELTGPLAAPAFVRGRTGTVAGTWYYSTADPSTLNHDPRDASNAGPATAGGTWLTAAEITDFADVTAVRFVSAGPLPASTRVRAEIPLVSTSDELNNVYVNRAQIFSSTFPNQPLLSNEPYVIMPGFTLGDFVWNDRNGNGRFDTGEPGLAGVEIEVLDENGDVIATTTTNANGRWSVTRIPAGTYTVRIPSEMFQEGGPLADFVVRTSGSGSEDTDNERADNNNTVTPDPRTTGLTSTPVTLSYAYDDDRLVGGNGPAGDDVAGLAPALIPDSFSTFTVDLALMPEPDIDIEKFTNGQDADEPTGPNVTVGGAVRWTYVVTNTGGVNLTDVTVTDDKVDPSLINCNSTGTNVVAGPLAPGASFTCVATGVATEGQYENMGTVVGTDPANDQVTDEDPSHYFGIRPAVDIEKSTNGQDADEPTGPNVTVGGDVRWTYVVTNTGNVPLTDVTVTDDMVAASEIDCGTGSNVVAGPLAPGDTFTCVAMGVATLGQYANMGTVVGTAPATTDVNGGTVAGAVVTDNDPSHYFGVQPRVDIEKATNGQDADDPTGPLVRVGDEVRWTYVVTNTGNVPLTDVTVTDDMEDASGIDCDETGSNVVEGPLQPGDSFTCIATGVAVEGQYRNVGTVVGTGPETTDVDGETVEGEEVGDEDLSHYFGMEPDVDIEKATNTQDADEPTGPYVTVGGVVRWTYVVTNTGNVPLTDVTVTDDVEDAASIDCAGTGSNVVPGPLAPGASVTCVATGTATAGQYRNLGAVTATGPQATDVDGNPVDGEEVSDEDLSHYFGAQPAIDIEKATNTHDADEPVGPLVSHNGGVVWTYVVTNTGNVTLSDVEVTDDVEAASSITCEGADGNVIDELEPGESVECTATGTGIVGQYANLGTATGLAPATTDENGDDVPRERVTDDDWSHYFGVDAAVDIEKAVNGQDADEPTGPLVAVGGAVQWTYVVTNTGNHDLTDVTVTDDMVDSSEIDCDGTDSNVIPGPLAPGASFTCVADGIAVAGQYVNTGTVVATGPEVTDVDGTRVPGVQVTDADLAHYFGVAPQVDIEKATNGEDADDPRGPSIPLGGAVEWTYVVTNTGNVALTDVTVTDDVEDAESIDCAGSGGNVVPGPLAPGESFTCVAHGTAIGGQYANLGTVVGTGPATTDVVGAPVPGVTVTDEDWSHYFGTVEPAVLIAPPTTVPPTDENPPPPPPFVRDLLAQTGGTVNILPLAAGALLVGGGLAVVLLGRRRREDERPTETVV